MSKSRRRPSSPEPPLPVWLLRILRFFFSRIFIVTLLLLIQVALFWILFNRFFEYSLTFYTLGTIFSAITVVYLISNRDNPAYQLAWAVFILAISPIGAIIYWIFGWQKMPPKQSKTINRLLEQTGQLLAADPHAAQELARLNPQVSRQSLYLSQWLDYPLYRHTQTRYLATGEAFFTEFKRQLQNAKHFIFLEYFIINEDSAIWQEILGILIQKAHEGVEIRLLYDDFGSLLLVSSKFIKKMASFGIKALAFNRFRPFLEIRMNNRDHRKIAVIDNQVAFTGGINLADEYMNVISLHGYWKDTAIVLEGEAVWSFTLMFLQFWHFALAGSANFEAYHLPCLKSAPNDGFVQPFADAPQDNENTSRNVYLDLINQAQNEIIITTPYLIIDQEMSTALSLAAKKGVSVKIIVPGIADKWYNKLASEAYYAPLLDAGVQIYKYQPGFIHSKTFLVDGQVGVIGTINLDYRSLYLNFEDGVWMYQTQALRQLHQDLQEILTHQAAQISINSIKKVHLPTRMLRGILRLVSTLM